MIERLFIILAIIAAVYAVRFAVRAWTRYRIQHTPAASEIAMLSGIVQPGRAAVLAFSTPGCAECRSRQRPALETLQTSLGDAVQIAHLSVPEHPELVEQFGIMTVPATVVLDRQGTTRHINLRYASAEHLHTQLHGVGI